MKLNNIEKFALKKATIEDILKLDDIEKFALKKATIDLIKISFFIGFIPSVMALIVDLKRLGFELKKLTPNTSLSEVYKMMSALIPDNSLYIKILGAYVFIHSVVLFIVFIKSHYEHPINQKALNFCKFFSPIAEVLFQLLAIVAGFFITLFILSTFIVGFMASIKYLTLAVLILLVSIPIVMFNIVIMKKYVEKENIPDPEMTI